MGVHSYISNICSISSLEPAKRERQHTFTQNSKSMDLRVSSLIYQTFASFLRKTLFGVM